jgi:uncharacterized protein YjeT (DUF2065 family)
MTRNSLLTLYLRLVGTVASLAAICAVMPLRWMDTIHRAIGMGALPDGPIVEYLARSTSAFYALMGALLWMLSFDLVRYHMLVRRLGMAIIALGILLLWVDIMAGMPWYWQAIEGPANVVLGTIILWAARNSLGASPPPGGQ